MAVRNWRHALVEKVQFITPDGLKYELHDPPKRAIMSMDGWGLPSANISTSQGPFQHGTTPLSIRLPHREINMLIRRNGCNRNDYWAIRNDLNNHLRLSRTNLNLPEPAHLRRYLSDGRVRQLDVMIGNGPGYSEGGKEWDSWSFMEELTFIAHNPLIYDPDQKTALFSGDLACVLLEQLQFPLVFGTDSSVVFGGDSCEATASLDITYMGDWEEFPKISLYGPGRNVIITHLQTGMQIGLDYTLSLGETVTFDLTYSRKTITNNYGASLLGYLTEESNLGGFALQPDPIVAGGVNTIEVSLNDGTGSSNVTIQYYNRYTGL